jgi:hypothetical protein
MRMTYKIQCIDVLPSTFVANFVTPWASEENVVTLNVLLRLFQDDKTALA